MSRTVRSLSVLSLLPGLVFLLACGGGGGGGGASASSSSPTSSATAQTLTYTNPGAGAYQLVKNVTKSTSKHLVLDLLGPTGTVSGVGFYLVTDPTKVTWSPVDPGDTEWIKSAVFANTLVKSKVSTGTLQAGVYQKGTTSPVVATPSLVLASVALDLKANVAITTPPVITLTAGKALVLNAPIDAVPTTTISISVGTLTAN